VEEDEIMKPISPFLAAFIKMMVPECEEHLRSEALSSTTEAMLPPHEAQGQPAIHDKWQ
jgi:hypothetical protein